MTGLDSFGFDNAIHIGEIQAAGGIDWEAWKSAMDVPYIVPTNEEMGKLEEFLSVQYRRIYVEREINIMDSYREATTFTLGVAKKALLDITFKGGNPKDESQMAATDFLPAYVGLNEWEDNVSGAGNSINTLFDASTSNVGGTAGTELKVGSLVGAHLIVGYEQPGYSEGGTGYHVTSRVLFTKGGIPNTVTTFDVNASTDTKITLLTKPIILIGGSIHNTFKAESYIKGALATNTDTVKPLGISFLNAGISRKLLPSDFSSSTKELNSVVLSA